MLNEQIGSVDYEQITSKIKETILNFFSDLNNELGSSNDLRSQIKGFALGSSEIFIKLLYKQIDVGETNERFIQLVNKFTEVVGPALCTRFMIPIPMVGEVVGSLLGVLLCQTIKKYLDSINKRTENINKLKEIQQQYNNLTQIFKKFKVEYQNFAKNLNLDKIDFFKKQFSKIDNALLNENYDEIIEISNNITTATNGRPLIQNIDDVVNILNS